MSNDKIVISGTAYGSTVAQARARAKSDVEVAIEAFADGKFDWGDTELRPIHTYSFGLTGDDDDSEFFEVVQPYTYYSVGADYDEYE